MNKLSTNKLTNNFAIWTTTAVALSTAGFLVFTSTPNLSPKASATDATLDVSVTVPLYLSLAIQNLSSTTIDTVSAEIQNGNSGTTNTAKVIASTNNAYGYELTLADSDSITDLAPYNSSTGEYDTTGPKISPISGEMALASFSPNTWGYGVVYSNTNTNNPSAPSTFKPITTSPVSLSTDVDEPGTGYHYFTAAAKIGDSLAAGMYEDELVFSLTAAAPPPIPTDFFELDGEYMQSEYLATLCTTATTPLASATNLDTDGSHKNDTSYVPSITMVDERDDQQYTVRKLADGNCWMTENLRFGITPSDGTANANQPRPWNASTDVALSDNVDTGNMANLTTGHIATTNSSDPNWTNSYDQPYIAIYGANDTDSSTGTKWGVLYNYCAASGGTNCTDPESYLMIDATGSICPAGWSMPSFVYASTGSGGITGGTVKSYDNLLNVYGVGDWGTPDVLLSAPLSFPFSGEFYSGGLSSRGGGYDGRGDFWSSSAGGEYYSFVLSLYSDDAAQNYGSRDDGHSVRCVSD